MFPSGWTKAVPDAVGDTTRRVPNASESPVPMNLHLLPSQRYAWVLADAVRPLPSTVIFIPVAVSIDGKPSGAFIMTRALPCRLVVHIWSVGAPPTRPPNTYDRAPSPAIIGRVRV